MATKTRAELKAEIASLLADNTNAAITPEDVRTIMDLMVDSDFNLTDDDADDVPAIETTITANTNVAANTTARHSHSAGAAIADSSFPDQQITDSSGGNASTDIQATPDAKTNDAIASILVRLNIHDDSIAGLTSKVNSILDRLESYGVINP